MLIYRIKMHSWSSASHPLYYHKFCVFFYYAYNIEFVPVQSRSRSCHYVISIILSIPFRCRRTLTFPPPPAAAVSASLPCLQLFEVRVGTGSQVEPPNVPLHPTSTVYKCTSWLIIPASNCRLEVVVANNLTPKNGVTKIFFVLFYTCHYDQYPHFGISVYPKPHYYWCRYVLNCTPFGHMCPESALSNLVVVASATGFLFLIFLYGFPGHMVCVLSFRIHHRLASHFPISGLYFLSLSLTVSHSLRRQLCSLLAPLIVRSFSPHCSGFPLYLRVKSKSASRAGHSSATIHFIRCDRTDQKCFQWRCCARDYPETFCVFGCVEPKEL